MRPLDSRAHVLLWAQDVLLWFRHTQRSRYIRRSLKTDGTVVGSLVQWLVTHNQYMIFNFNFQMTFLPVLHSFIQTREQLLREWYLSKFHLFPFYTKPLPMLWGMRVKRIHSKGTIFALGKLEYFEKLKILRKFYPFHLLCCFFSDLVSPNWYFCSYQEYFLVSSFLFNINWMTGLAMIFPLLHCCGWETLGLYYFFGHKTSLN